MAEFSQNGAIVTLHRLGSDRGSAIEAELEQFAHRRRLALLLPCLFEELASPALTAIVDDLQRVRYIDQIVVSLRKAPPDGLPLAQQFFSRLPQPVTIVWNDGPRLETFFRLLESEGLDVGCDSRGRAWWIGCGYLLAKNDCDVIVAHGCDITTYSRELLARLCFPLAHPDFEFEFAKGYYARLGGGEMHGRVSRLFVAPLIRAVRTVLGPSPALTYLDSFRYPLAGEFAMTAGLARLTNVPADRGLELGMLMEVYNNCEPSNICQTELCDRYDHAHQLLDADERRSGLWATCVDTARSILASISDEGLALTGSCRSELVTTYRQIASEMVGHYQADAAINGLSFARARETMMVSMFAAALKKACQGHLARRIRAPLLPGWTHVSAALPDFSGWLREAIELDGAARVSCEVI